MRALAVAERMGIPSVAIAATGFMALASATARMEGIPDAAIAEYPGLVSQDSPEVFRTKVRAHVVPAVVAGLRQGNRHAARASAESKSEPADRIVFEGDLGEVQEFFLEQGWSDGLPVIPPTLAEVQKFLAQTDRAPQTVLGVLLPEWREATVWNVAVNGVMAGCRPEYMPILIAIVEAIADPEFRLEDAGATPGWEPLVVISGPRTEELGFNTGAGAMRVGRQANTSIGRFLRLIMRTVAGYRIPPGMTDKGTFGYSFNVALAENEAEVTRIGWAPFRVDRGFSMEDTVVTVQSVVAYSPPIYSGGGRAESVIQPIQHFLGTMAGPWMYTGLIYGRWNPLIAMSPSIASVFASDGWTKDDIRRALYERSRIPADLIEGYPEHVGGKGFYFHFDSLIEARFGDRLSPEEARRSGVPAVLRPESIGIVVTGDPARNQSKVLINNHEQGFPVSRRVQWPEAGASGRQP